MSDSLEDMLAALEGSGGSSQPQRQPLQHREPSVIEEYQKASNLDDFLETLDAESGPAQPRMAPKRQSVTVAPQASAPAQSYQELYSAPREIEESNPEHEAAAHEAHANANWFDPSISPEYRSASEAAQALEKEGYAIHVNKGKWINYQGGSASDFRIKGTTSTKIGYIHAITLRSLDDYGNPAKISNPRDFIGAVLTHRQSSDEIQCWYRDNGDATYDLAFYAQKPGTVRLEIKLCGNPMFDIDIQVEAAGRSVWTAKPQLPVDPGKRFTIDIATEDGSRPEGVAPFEVQSMGDVEDLKLMNNGDGTYKFMCTPQTPGFITIQIMLHGQPIKGSPVTVPVGQKQGHFVKQASKGVDEKSIGGIPSTYAQATASSTPSSTPSGNVSRVLAAQTVSVNRPSFNQPDPAYTQAKPAGGAKTASTTNQSGDFYGDTYVPQEVYQPRQSNADVSNDDLNALLDELGA